ncbi:hypothetical protein BGZ93_005972 [Podila epicladia]|nr:hypothetical protein BGZ92_008611 [Podila epicladia]KAG0095371.1 hypothetical protein BGZ93_005972 [Podila epicladia]
MIAKGLSNTIDKPFTHLYNKTWLHNRSEKDMFRLLVDCFRLKLEDDYKFEGDVPADSLWANLADAIEKGDLIDHYGDANMPMQLRMLREQITGRGPMGQSGLDMMRVQMSGEGGQLPFRSTFDMTRLGK